MTQRMAATSSELFDQDEAPALVADTESDIALAFLGELRRRTAAQLPSRWRLNTVLAERYSVVLSHLHPPEFAAGEDRWIARWRETFGFYKLYYRVGPGFVQVVDYRSSPAGEETIFEGEEANRFRQLDSIEQPHSGSSPGSAAGDLTDRLRSLDFYLPGETRGLLLPYRVKRWPVPWVSV